MERIKEAFKQHQRSILIGTAAAGTLALGYYGLRRIRASHKSFVGKRDPDFNIPNLPLYHEEALKRDKILKSVNYDLLLNLLPLQGDGGKESFAGRINVNFTLNTEVTKAEIDKDLFLDFNGELITDLQINKTRVPSKDINFKKHRIYIDHTHLNPEQENTV